MCLGDDESGRSTRRKDVLRMLTHRVTRGWVLILGRSLELFFRELAVSDAATRDKHGVPDGKLLERDKIEIFPLTIGHCCTALRVKNTLEIALSLMVFEIFTLFHFTLKFKMAAKKAIGSTCNEEK